MRDVGVHLEWILARIGELPPVEADLAAAHGLTLAAAAVAAHDLPLWDASAMDGYALRSADAAEASETQSVMLRVTGEVAAGSAADLPLAPGEAVRIMTGAPVPSDADAVVPVELTIGDASGAGGRGDSTCAHGNGDGDGAGPGSGRGVWAEHEVQLTAPVERGANVRPRGEDRRRGDLIGAAGDELGALRLSALAAAGIHRVRVRPRPCVAVVVTGAELRAPGAALKRGQIPESNSLLITGLLRELGIEPVAVRVDGDDPALLARTLDEVGAQVDVIITTGGIGPGRHDVVRLAVEGEPAVEAVRVAMKPGQPQCAGRLRAGAWLFALPGNPVSAAVGFEVFVRPALLAMQGRADPHRLRVPATAAAGWRRAPGRVQVLPVRVWNAGAGLLCEPTVNARAVSHAVGGQGAANGFAWVPAERGDVAAGDTVEVLLVGL